jgi:hypothetical protein
MKKIVAVFDFKNKIVHYQKNGTLAESVEYAERLDNHLASPGL